MHKSKIYQQKARLADGLFVVTVFSSLQPVCTRRYKDHVEIRIVKLPSPKTSFSFVL